MGVSNRSSFGSEKGRGDSCQEAGWVKGLAQVIVGPSLEQRHLGILGAGKHDYELPLYHQSDFGHRRVARYRHRFLTPTDPWSIV